MATSRVACSSFSIGANATISIARDKSSYTHTLSYKFGTATGTIVTKTTNTSVIWSPTASTLYAQIPNASSGYGEITCQTYEGNTLIGTSKAGFYAYAVRQDCLPEVTATIVDTNSQVTALTGSTSKFVNYISKPKVTVTATPKNSATIKTINIDNVGLIATESPYTFNTMYDKYFKITATDSRGYSATTPYEVDMVDYVPCHYDSVSIKRTESTSTTATLTLNGYCFKGSFGSVSNTLTVKYRYKTTGNYGSYVNVTPTWNEDGTFTATANVPNLSLSEQYTFEVIAQDKLTSFGDGEEILLSKGMGDIRITSYNIQTKNYVIIGDNNNTAWKGLITKRKFGDVSYDSLFGSGNIGSDPVTSIELKQGQSVLGRFDVRKDGHLYNYLSGMSVAEITSMATGSEGFCLLDGGGSNPILIQWGRVSITPTGANVLTQAEVNFIYEFQGLPMIFTDKITWDSDVVFVNPYAVENRKFIMNLKRHNVVTTVIQWIAIGNGSYALPE